MKRIPIMVDGRQTVVAVPDDATDEEIDAIVADQAPAPKLDTITSHLAPDQARRMADAPAMSAHQPAPLTDEQKRREVVKAGLSALAHPIDSMRDAAPAIGGMARQAANGASFGLLPAASAALAATVPALDREAAGDGATWGDRFRHAKSDYQGRLDKTREIAGPAGTALEMAGGLATAASVPLPSPASSAAAQITGGPAKTMLAKTLGGVIDTMGYAGTTAALSHSESPEAALAAANGAMTDPTNLALGASAPAAAEVTAQVQGPLSRTLSRFSSRRALQSLEPSPQGIQTLRDHFGGPEEGGAALRDMTMPDGSYLLQPGNTAEEISTKLRALADITGAEKGELVQMADAAGVTGNPADLVGRLKQIYNKHFGDVAGRTINSEHAAAARKLIGQIEEEFRTLAIPTRRVKGAAGGGDEVVAGQIDTDPATGEVINNDHITQRDTWADGKPLPGGESLSPDGTIRDQTTRRNEHYGDTQRAGGYGYDRETKTYFDKASGLTVDEARVRRDQLDSQIADVQARMKEMQQARFSRKSTTAQAQGRAPQSNLVRSLQKEIDWLTQERAAVDDIVRFEPGRNDTTRPQPDNGRGVLLKEQPFSAYEGFKTKLGQHVHDTAAQYPRSDEAIANNPGLRFLNETQGAIIGHNDNTYAATMGEDQSARFADVKRQFGDATTLGSLAGPGANKLAATQSDLPVPVGAHDRFFLHRTLRNFTPEQASLSRWSDALARRFQAVPALTLDPTIFNATAALRGSEE